jgi:hypothetical protein
MRPVCLRIRKREEIEFGLNLNRVGLKEILQSLAKCFTVDGFSLERLAD